MIMKSLGSHLKYMDNLKIYPKNREEMRRCIELVEVISKDIKMDFILDECTVIHIKQCTPSNVPFLSDISTLQLCDSYKYLGIAESSTILHDDMKKTAKSEYIRRVIVILKAKITVNNTLNALYSFTMPILRYGIGVLRWTKTELLQLDRKIRKILTGAGFYHPKSNTHCLHSARPIGDRGICSAFGCHQQ